MAYLIAASLLAADLMRLGEEVTKVMQAGADMVHCDIMDNHYVPNLSFGPFLSQALHQSFPELILDLHLMASPVDALITECAKVGARRISIHPDATIHLDSSLQRIRQQGCQAGLVLNPATSLECLTYCIHRLDFILVMTVNPGFGGQFLIPEVLSKISTIRACYPLMPICVDGGITCDNIAELARAGATEFVIGSALFATKEYTKTLAALRAQLESI